MDSAQKYKQMIEERIPGEHRSVVVGCEKNLELHLDNIKSEFCGMPVLCFHMAKTIVLIRREIDLDHNLAEFFAVLDSHVELICEYLSTRWLVAVCDTIVDYGSPLQRASALSVVVLVNSIKLAESERLMEQRSLCEVRQTEYFEDWPHELWDGVTSYQPARGDMPRNMFRRIENSLESTPVVATIFAAVKTKLVDHDNLYSRLAAMNRTGFWQKRNAA